VGGAVVGGETGAEVVVGGATGAGAGVAVAVGVGGGASDEPVAVGVGAADAGAGAAVVGAVLLVGAVDPDAAPGAPLEPAPVPPPPDAGVAVVPVGVPAADVDDCWPGAPVAPGLGGLAAPICCWVAAIVRRIRAMAELSASTWLVTPDTAPVGAAATCGDDW